MTGGWTDDSYHCGACQERKQYPVRGCQLPFTPKQDVIALGKLFAPAWIPTFRYKVTNPDGKGKQPRSFSLYEHQSWECPKSVLQGSPAYEYVRKFQQAQRQKRSLSKLMGDAGPFLEDVEELLLEAQLIVKNAWAEERNKY